MPLLPTVLLGAIAGFTDHFKIGFGFQQAAQAVAKNGMIVGDHDADGLRSSVIHTLLPAFAEYRFPTAIPGQGLILS